MRNARAEAQDAADSLDAARAALAAVEATQEGAADALKAADKRVSDLARVVLSRHIEPAVADVARLKEALSEAMGTLYLLHSECFDWPPSAASDRIKFLLYLPELHLNRDNPGAVNGQNTSKP